ncbi:unnamed protein product [Brassica oleracea var. botrytis]|uniref:Uncharacterized protein n=1 Tax=Brassica oleracea TaxID=3712 RepID=A0A3P6GCY4_BRAOL|nr:unnamed protein product [Brassica oleracea]
MLCFFSQQNLAKPNYLIQNLALMVQNTKTTGIRSMREISLCYISRRRTTGQPVIDDWGLLQDSGNNPLSIIVTCFQESMWSKDGIRYEVCRSTCQYLQYGSGCEAKCCS